MNLNFAKSCLSLAALTFFTASGPTSHAAELRTFKKIQLHDQFWSEGANFGDLNNDGVNDFIAGPWWWEGPDFTKKHEFYPSTKTFDLKLGPMTSVKVPGFHGTLGKENAYSDNFFVWTLDFNKDGWQDILVIGFPGQDTSWFENPKGKEGHWVRHKIFDQTDNESPTWVDLTGDGKPELVCITKGRYGYAEPDWNDAAKPWKFHPITPDNKYGNFTHGMGVGDVNGDGRMDLLEKGGWWEQPASLAGDPVWKHHQGSFGVGGAQMYAYDVNGDGLNDIITSLSAHGFGLAWYEQYREAGEIKFREHMIMNKEPSENKYGNFTHGMGVGDVNGDGRADLIEKDGWWEQPASLAGDPVWAQHKTPFGGGGAQMYAYDVNGDGLNDVITSLAAHAFGLSWFEQYREGSEIKFREHLLMGKEPSENKYGVKFSEVHAIDLVDMDGDGLKDIVTGKRFWSHGRTQDPERNSQAVSYWFKLKRGADKSVDFIPYLIDNDSGVGTQVVAGDINKDGLPDVVVGNKKGAYILLQQNKSVSQEEWDKAQPKPFKAGN